MRYVVSIDVGIQNLGLCIADISVLPAEVVVWERVRLCSSSKYYPAETVSHVVQFVQKYKSYFNELAKLIIEQQMRTNMRMVEAALHALFHANTIVLNPRVVKVHYNLSTRNYKTNKLAAVTYVVEHLDDHKLKVYIPHALWCAYLAGKKQDDLADALIMLLYFLETYSESWVDTTTRISLTPPQLCMTQTTPTPTTTTTT